LGRQCHFCEKRTRVGNQVTLRGKAKYLGGVGTKVTGITRRTFKPNLQRLKIVDNGCTKTILICTQCIRSGRATRPLKNRPFREDYRLAHTLAAATAIDEKVGKRQDLRMPRKRADSQSRVSKQQEYPPIQTIVRITTERGEVDRLHIGEPAKLVFSLSGGPTPRMLDALESSGSIAGGGRPKHVDIVVCSRHVNVEPLVQRLRLPPAADEEAHFHVSPRKPGEIEFDVFFQVFNETVDRWDFRVKVYRQRIENK